jgi:hypothetical protein
MRLGLNSKSLRLIGEDNVDTTSMWKQHLTWGLQHAGFHCCIIRTWDVVKNITHRAKKCETVLSCPHCCFHCNFWAIRSDRLYLSIHGTLQAVEFCVDSRLHIMTLVLFVWHTTRLSPYELTIGTKTIRPSKIRILWIKIADSKELLLKDNWKLHMAHLQIVCGFQKLQLPDHMQCPKSII